MKREDIIIEADELLGKLDDPNVRIYDATILFFSKDPESAVYKTYLKGHIPGAAVFDHLQFSDPDGKYDYTILSEAALVDQIGKIGISNESEVIIYASSAIPSATRAWWILRYAGHDNVRILNGGLPAWKKAGGTLEQERREYAPAIFKPNVRPEMLVTLEDVKTAQKDKRVWIEFVLPFDVYGGAHIPGSHEVSCLNIMTDDMNILLDDQVLRSELKDGAAHERVIAYCGGGIAATVNAVAHLVNGHENVAVYNGSLIEWMGEKMPLDKADVDKSLIGFIMRTKRMVMLAVSMIRQSL